VGATVNVSEAAEILTHAHLIACGYHRPKESTDVPEANAKAYL